MISADASLTLLMEPAVELHLTTQQDHEHLLQEVNRMDRSVNCLHSRLNTTEELQQQE